MEPRSKQGEASTSTAPPAKRQRVDAADTIKDAPEGAVFDLAARRDGRWVSPLRPGGPNGPAPVWCLWQQDSKVGDDDDATADGAWQVKWSDETTSFLAQDEVRVCEPMTATQEEGESAPVVPAQKPGPKKGATYKMRSKVTLSGAKRAAYGSLQPDGKAKPSKERHCKNCGAPMKGHPRDGLRLVCPYPPKED